MSNSNCVGCALCPTCVNVWCACDTHENTTTHDHKEVACLWLGAYRRVWLCECVVCVNKNDGGK